jgi:hypothetical protein
MALNLCDKGGVIGRCQKDSADLMGTRAITSIGTRHPRGSLAIVLHCRGSKESLMESMSGDGSSVDVSPVIIIPAHHRNQGTAGTIAMSR